MLSFLVSGLALLLALLGGSALVRPPRWSMDDRPWELRLDQHAQRVQVP